jgi:hypothetical protein
MGIWVRAHDVTIDLNGFTLRGNHVGTHGIVSDMNSLTVKNGTISIFKGNGVHGAGPFWVIDNMRIVFNAGNGIFAIGRSGSPPPARQWIISNSEIAENGMAGIDVGLSTTSIGPMLIRNNLVNGNKEYGIAARHGHVEGNIVSGNGSTGIFLGDMGMVLGNTITDNFRFGISTGSGAYGNNTLLQNNLGGSGLQINGGTALHPNVCNGAAC